MEYFVKLGQLVDALWQEAHQHVAAFPEAASKALAELPPIQHVNSLEVVRWVLRSPDLPEQHDPLARFGEPPVTVYTSGRFCIEVRYWVDTATSIHQHSFCGAFYVLEGSGVQCEFSFDEEYGFNHHLKTGEIHLKGLELLKKGDCRPFPAGDEFIHSLFYLDRPSMSIVIRTDVPSSGPQFSYLWPYIALDDNRPNSQRLVKRLQVLEMLRKIEHPQFVEMLTETLLDCEPDELVRLLDQNRGFFLGKPQQLRDLLARIEQRFPHLIASLIPVFIETARRNHLLMLRTFTQQPQPRYFLALLLNLRRRSDLLRLIADRFGEADPSEWVLDQVTRIAELRLLASVPSAAPWISVQPLTQPVLRGVLAGQSAQEIAAQLAREEVAEATSVEREYARLRAAKQLTPLFAD